jgi:cysteine desulfurase
LKGGNALFGAQRSLPYIEMEPVPAIMERRVTPTRIYLDHAATTPMLPEAMEAMADACSTWANPSSPHREGRAARASLEHARERIKAALGWGGELIFTSGASEAAAIALGRTTMLRVAVSAVEHLAVLGARSDAQILSVDRQGLIGADVPEQALVAVQQVNSETGVLQPVDLIASEVRARGGLLFADCAQGAGKLALPDADLIAVSAHKFGGPPGIGALLVRHLTSLRAYGQGQEQGYRPGTENMPAVLGFAAAIEAMVGQGASWLDEAGGWRAHLDTMVRAAGGNVVADDAPKLPLIASYRMPGVSAAVQLMRFDAAGFAVSAGSACSSGSMKASHVLAALGMDPRVAGEVIRVSFGHSTTSAEVDAFAHAWTIMARDVRARAA